MLDKEFAFYLEHQNELVSLYDGKYVMVVGENVATSPIGGWLTIRTEPSERKLSTWFS